MIYGDSSIGNEDSRRPKTRPTIDIVIKLTHLMIIFQPYLTLLGELVQRHGPKARTPLFQMDFHESLLYDSFLLI